MYHAQNTQNYVESTLELAQLYIYILSLMFDSYVVGAQMKSLKQKKFYQTEGLL